MQTKYMNQGFGFTLLPARLVYIVTLDQYRAPEAARVTRDEHKDIRDDLTGDHWEKQGGEINNNNTLYKILIVKKAVTDYIKSQAAGGNLDWAFPVSHNKKFYSVKVGGKKETPTYTVFEVKFNRKKFEANLEARRQGKLKNLFPGEYGVDITVKKRTDTLSRSFMQQTYPDKTILDYQYTFTVESVTDGDKKFALQRPANDWLIKADRQEGDYSFIETKPGKYVRVKVNKKADGALELVAYNTYAEKKFDKKTYDRNYNFRRDQYLAVMNALARAGINPDMGHIGDRFEVSGGVVYIDRVVGGQTKHFLVKLYSDATPSDRTRQRPKAGSATGEMEDYTVAVREYVDITGGKNREQLNAVHRRLDQAKDALTRGVLLNIFLAYGIKHDRPTRAQIWQTEMGKTDPYKGSFTQNSEMATWLRNGGNETRLLDMAKKYPANGAARSEEVTTDVPPPPPASRSDKQEKPTVPPRPAAPPPPATAPGQKSGPAVVPPPGPPAAPPGAGGTSGIRNRSGAAADLLNQGRRGELTRAPELGSAEKATWEFIQTSPQLRNKIVRDPKTTTGYAYVYGLTHFTTQILPDRKIRISLIKDDRPAGVLLLDLNTFNNADLIDNEIRLRNL